MNTDDLSDWLVPSPTKTFLAHSPFTFCLAANAIDNMQAGKPWNMGAIQEVRSALSYIRVSSEYDFKQSVTREELVALCRVFKSVGLLEKDDEPTAEELRILFQGQMQNLERVYLCQGTEDDMAQVVNFLNDLFGEVSESLRNRVVSTRCPDPREVIAVHM